MMNHQKTIDQCVDELVHELRKRGYLSGAPDAASGLASPDGGELINRIVPDDQLAAKRAEAATLPMVPLTDIDVNWLQVVGEGWAAPLKGFMREGALVQALHFNSLLVDSANLTGLSGYLSSPPTGCRTTSPTSASRCRSRSCSPSPASRRVGKAKAVALTNSAGQPLAILRMPRCTSCARARSSRARGDRRRRAPVRPAPARAGAHPLHRRRGRAPRPHPVQRRPRPVPSDGGRAARTVQTKGRRRRVRLPDGRDDEGPRRGAGGGRPVLGSRPSAVEKMTPVPGQHQGDGGGIHPDLDGDGAAVVMIYRPHRGAVPRQVAPRRRHTFFTVGRDPAGMPYSSEPATSARPTTAPASRARICTTPTTAATCSCRRRASGRWSSSASRRCTTTRRTTRCAARTRRAPTISSQSRGRRCASWRRSRRSRARRDPSDLIEAKCIPPGFMVQKGWEIVSDYYIRQKTGDWIRTRSSSAASRSRPASAPPRSSRSASSASRRLTRPTA